MNLFSKNAGKIDRIIRVVMGLILLSLIFIGPQSILGLIGLIPLLTGIFGTCPIDSIFGINTCKFD